MDNVGAFKESFLNRELTVEMLEEAPVKHIVSGMIEFDVTKARQHMLGHKEETGETLSFTGWLIKCIGQAVSEHREVQAYRKGKKKLVVFDDVDVGITVEREVGGRKTPMGYVVRRANEKSFRQIHDEIRAVQAQGVEGGVPGVGGAMLGEGADARFVRAFRSMPKFIRKLFWWRFKRDPFFKKKIMGTVGITAVGMFGNIRGWPLPVLSGYQSLGFAIGGITSKPAIVDGKIEVHEYLSMTVMFDHDVVDGAPAARFVNRLAELIQDGFGLEQE